MDIMKMLKEAQGLQKSLAKAQSELSKIEVKGTSRNEFVEVTMTAQGELKAVKIKEEAVNPNDIKKLEDLVLSAFKDATGKAASISKQTLGKLTGGLGLPPM